VYYYSAFPRNVTDNIIEGNEKGKLILTYSSVLGENVIYGMC